MFSFFSSCLHPAWRRHRERGFFQDVCHSLHPGIFEGCRIYSKTRFHSGLSRREPVQRSHRCSSRARRGAFAHFLMALFGAITEPDHPFAAPARDGKLLLSMIFLQWRRAFDLVLSFICWYSRYCQALKKNWRSMV